MDFISDIRKGTKKKDITEGTHYALEKIYLMINCLFVSTKIRNTNSLSEFDFSSIDLEYKTNKSLRYISNGLALLLEISANINLHLAVFKSFSLFENNSYVQLNYIEYNSALIDNDILKLQTLYNIMTQDLTKIKISS